MTGARGRAWAAALFLLALAFAAGARAQAVLEAGRDRLDLWPHVRILSDPTRELTSNQVAKRGDAFKAPQGAYATLGMGDDAVWLRVPLVVKPGAEGAWVLDIDYALLRSVEAFLVREGATVPLGRTGLDVPYAQRPLPGRSQSIPVTLAAGESQLLVRVQTAGARILPFTLQRLPAFHGAALDELILQGLLGAVALVLVLNSLAQWAVSREALHLKYALLVTCSALFSVHFFGIGSMYLWPGHEWAERHLAGLTSLGASFATALFVEEAIRRDLARWARRTLIVLAALQGSFALAHAVDLLDIRQVGVIMGTIGLMPGLVGLTGAVTAARRGDAVGTWFIVAWIGYFIASAVMVGVVRGGVGANPWTLHSFQIGATLDMVVFMRIAVLHTAALRRERRKLKDSFSGYVGPAVLEEILSGRLSPDVAGEERHVCVMFSDIRGYTTRSEGTRPAEMLAFLNRWFDGVVGIVHQHGGTVVCFLGDGIMVAFGAPQKTANPSEAGWRAARGILEHLARVNAELAASGHEPLEIGIGLHAGEAVVGNIGSRDRHEYAVVGDVTNVAARLEKETKAAGYRVVLSDAVASRLESPEGLAPLGALALRGHTPVVAYGFGKA